jgi:hypothetical protein
LFVWWEYEVWWKGEEEFGGPTPTNQFSRGEVGIKESCVLESNSKRVAISSLKPNLEFL